MVRRVWVYRAPTTVADAEAIATWLDGHVSASVEVRERFLDQFRDPDLPAAFADARVISPYDPETGNSMLGVIRYEERVLDHPTRGGGVLYDGQQLQVALNRRIPAEESSLETLHVVLLDRVIGTWGGDGRWHKRVNVLGQPALVSVPGLYEAPAKPEAYYRAKQSRALLTGDAPPREVLEAEIEGEFLVENDPRTTDALKGYVLQAVRFVETGTAFCDNENCRLYNAHHQSDVIRAQLQDPEFCPDHDTAHP